MLALIGGCSKGGDEIIITEELNTSQAANEEVYSNQEILNDYYSKL